MSAKLLLGDCLELMDSIPDGSVDMVLCDLPYGCLNKGNPLAKWDCPLPFDELWKHWDRVCKQNAAVVLFGSGMFTAKLMISNQKAWKYNLIWKKGERVTGFLNSNRMPLRNHEDIVVFYRKQPTYNPQMVYAGLHRVNHSKGNLDNIVKNSCYGNFKSTEARFSEYKMPKSIINVQPEHKEFNHPTEKPVDLCRWLIETYTNQGDTVLDNCMGSGSTGVAAVLTGRNFVGIEKEQKYYDIAKERIDNV
jgi:site-specific DNA-methyltransferase (adenine-specific)/modification methylase